MADAENAGYRRRDDHRDGGRADRLGLAGHTGAGNSNVICQLQDHDGHLITIGSFWLTAGYGSWGNPELDRPAAVTSARLITTGGMILATVTFHAIR